MWRTSSAWTSTEAAGEQVVAVKPPVLETVSEPRAGTASEPSEEELVVPVWQVEETMALAPARQMGMV